MRIAAISDSHGSIPGRTFEVLEGADLILHLGDLGPSSLLHDLGALAPVLAVQGNNDLPGQPELPPRRLIREEGLTIHMRHLPWPASETRGAEAPSLFLFGHTHRPSIESTATGTLLCPGSLRLPRGGFPASYAWLILESGVCRISVRALSDRRLLIEESWEYR